MGAGGLAHRRGDNHKILTQKADSTAVGSDACVAGCIIVGVFGGNLVGIFSAGQGAEGGVVIHSTVIQHVLSTADRYGIASRCFTALIKARINVTSSSIQTVIGGCNCAAYREGVAADMSFGGRGSGQGDIRCNLVQICGISGIQISGFVVIAFNAIPVVAVAVAVQTGSGIDFTGQSRAEIFGLVCCADAAGLSVDWSAGIDGNLAVCRVVSAGSADIAFYVFGHTEVQIIYVPGTHEYTAAFGTAAVIGIAFYGGDVSTVRIHNQTYMGPASGEEQVALLGGVVISEEVIVVVAAGVQGRTAGVEVEIEAVGRAASGGGTLNNGSGDVGLLGAPGYEGGTPGSVLTAHGHTAVNIVVIPVIILGVVAVAAIIGAAGVAVIAALMVSGLGQGNIDDIIPLVAGQLNCLQRGIVTAGCVCG